MTEAMTVLRELATHRASTRLLTSDDARAILTHIDSLTAELAAAKGELRGIANSTGCVDACPCWAKLRRKAERAIALTSATPAPAPPALPRTPQ